MSDNNESFELETIHGHFFEGTTLKLHCGWKYWPLAAAERKDEDELKVSASELLAEYYKKIGIDGLSGEERQKKLRETAYAKAPEVVEDLQIERVTAHRTIDGELQFACRWSNGEYVMRPVSAFTETRDKELLKKYVGENSTADSPIDIRVMDSDDEMEDDSDDENEILDVTGGNTPDNTYGRSPKTPAPVARNVTTDGSPASASTSTNSATPSVARRRGRPKKNAASPTATPTSVRMRVSRVAGNAATAGTPTATPAVSTTRTEARGRPKKSDVPAATPTRVAGSPDGASAVSPPTASTTRPAAARGRPPKRPASTPFPFRRTVKKAASVAVSRLTDNAPHVLAFFKDSQGHVNAVTEKDDVKKIEDLQELFKKYPKEVFKAMAEKYIK